MAKKISTEEKKDKLMNIISSQYSFYDSNELEKIAIKEADINSMKVKDILKELVNDGMLCNEKIGIKSIYYIPYEDYNIKRVEDERDIIIKQIEDIDINIKEEMNKRRDTESRAQLENMKEELALIKQKRDIALKQNKIYNKKYNIDILKFNINKIVDNIFTIQQYANRNFNIDRNDFNRNFNIEELDYI